MKKIMMTMALAVSVAGAQGTTAPAKPAPAEVVKVTLAQDQIKASTVDGKTVETVVPNPRTVLPGDVLREEVTVVNVAGKIIKNPAISVPVPKGTVYAGSATPTGDRWKTVYSIDSGKTYSATPLKSVTVTENGKSVTRQVAAGPKDYTNVRWQIGQLNPEDVLKLSFRVRVN